MLNGTFSKEMNKHLTIFYPTYLITGVIFKKVLESKCTNTLEGHYGIAKSFSIVLLKILTDFIIRYKMKYQE